MIPLHALLLALGTGLSPVALAEAPPHAQAVLDARSLPNRKGEPYFSGGVFEDPTVGPAILHRLRIAGDSADVRRALIQRLAVLDNELLAAHARFLLDNSSEARTRALIVEGLRRSDNPQADEILGQALADDSAEVRASAARTVGGRAESTVSLDQIAGLLDDSSPQVRASAAQALGWREDAAQWGPLTRRLDDDDAQVRRSALRALERISAERAAKEPAVAQLLADPDPGVARAAKRVVER